MGIAKNGILGPASGKVGPAVWYFDGVRNVVRSKSKRDAPPTMAELKNRLKMKTLMDLFSTLKPYLRAGFSVEANGLGLNYHNVATSCNRLRISELEGGLEQLDYENLQLSKGTATMAEAPMVTAEANGLRFSWMWQPDDFESAEDQVMMMAYLPEQNTSLFETAGAKRSHLQDFLALPHAYLQARIEVYISFTAKDRTRVSDSLYLGRIN